MKRIFTFCLSVMSVGMLLTASDRISAQSSRVAAESPQAPSAALLTEDFSFSGALTANGWSAHSGIGTNPLGTTTGLTYAGFPGSGVGNAALVQNLGGEDANRPLSAEQNTNGSVIYFGFMANVTDAATAKTGDYFIHLGDRVAPDAFTLFGARVFARIVGGNVNFGLSNTSTPTWGTTNFNRNQTYLLVVKYTINTGGADATSLWVFPSGVPASEAAAGTPEVTDTTTNGQDVIDAIALRQGSNANSAQTVVDGIRVGTTWSDATGAAAPPDAPVDFNGDGKTDFVVIRSTGIYTWYTFINGVGPMPTQDWGITNDVPVPADYDGDSRDDIAVWRGSSGTFYILNSQTQTFRVDAFGQAGDDPTVVGDYNNDGKDDVAVYRAGSPSNWFYKTTQASFYVQTAFGITGDTPAPGDYDGDGSNDIVVRRVASGTNRFFKLLSSGSFSAEDFGAAPSVVVPGDYDDDGKTDLATVRTAGGNYVWDYEPSGTAGSTVVSDTWGVAATDTLAPGDYTGDGRSDYAVWRSGNPGSFFVMTPQTRNIFTQQWGVTGDVPAALIGVHP